MNNTSLIKSISENFVVNKETGEISISQRKCAELLGVNYRSIGRFISNAPLFPESNQEDTEDFPDLRLTLIDEKLFVQLVKYYALESKAKNEKAQAILSKIVDAGTRAFLYSLAGYTFNINEPKKETNNLISNDEYESELRRLKLESARAKEEAKLKSILAKEEAKKLKYDNQTEVLKIQHASKIEALKSKQSRLLSKPDVKVRADLTIGKIIAPISPITDLLKLHGVKIKPAEFNKLLIKHGYLQENRMFLTTKGLFFGINHKSKESSKYSMPRWFENEFPLLLEEIKNLEPSLFN